MLMDQPTSSAATWQMERFGYGSYKTAELPL